MIGRDRSRLVAGVDTRTAGVDDIPGRGRDVDITRAVIEGADAIRRVPRRRCRGCQRLDVHVEPNVHRNVADPIIVGLYPVARGCRDISTSGDEHVTEDIPVEHAGILGVEAGEDARGGAARIVGI